MSACGFWRAAMSTIHGSSALTARSGWHGNSRNSRITDRIRPGTPAGEIYTNYTQRYCRIILTTWSFSPSERVPFEQEQRLRPDTMSLRPAEQYFDTEKNPLL